MIHVANQQTLKMKQNVLLSIKHYCCKGNWIANQLAKKKCKMFYYWYNFRHAHKVPFNFLNWGKKYNYIESSFALEYALGIFVASCLTVCTKVYGIYLFFCIFSEWWHSKWWHSISPIYNFKGFLFSISFFISNKNMKI